MAPHGIEFWHTYELADFVKNIGIGFAPLTQLVIVIQKENLKNARKFELLISDQIFEYLLRQNVSSEPVLPVQSHVKNQDSV